MIRYNRIEKMSLGHLVITGMYSKHKLKHFEKNNNDFYIFILIGSKIKLKIIIFWKKTEKIIIFTKSVFRKWQFYI